MSKLCEKLSDLQIAQAFKTCYNPKGNRCSQCVVFGVYDRADICKVNISRKMSDIVYRYIEDSGNVAKVVHSKWIQVGNTQEHYCEACGVTFNLYAYCKNDYKYCPYCGAVMDSKELTK